MPDIEFPIVGGTARGYLAAPVAGRGPATLVLQEWGLNEHIRAVCDRLASEGFFALAPDFYSGQSTSQQGLSMDQVEQDMSGAVEFLASQPGVEDPGVAALGFSLGGGLAIWAAVISPHIAAVVSYYYVMPHGKPDFTSIKGPVLGHFGTADALITLKEAKALEGELRAAAVDVTFDKYTGAGHAFFEDGNRLGTYDATAAARSWKRSMDFLHASLTATRT